MIERFEVKRRPVSLEKWSGEELVASLIDRSLSSFFWGKADFSESFLPKTIQLDFPFDRAREIAADTSRREFLHSEERRRKAQQIIEQYEGLKREEAEKRLRWIWETWERERGTYLAYYLAEGKVGWIEPTYGKVGRTSLPRREVLSQRAIPLIEFHVHTDESFFWPEDFFSLMIAFQEFLPSLEEKLKKPFPLCSAALLATKSDWFLALRTDLSPLFSSPEWFKLMKEKEEKRMKATTQLWAQYEELAKKRWQLLSQDFELLLKGEKPNRKIDKEREVIEENMTEINAAIIKDANERNLIFARSLGLALYRSSDGINFLRKT